MNIEMGDDRKNMINFVQGLLETMPLSSWKNREIRQKYCEKYNKKLTMEQSQLLRNVVLEVASSELARVKEQNESSKEVGGKEDKSPKITCKEVDRKEG